VGGFGEIWVAITVMTTVCSVVVTTSALLSHYKYVIHIVSRLINQVRFTRSRGTF
jgi:hypothetical protein